MNTAQQRTDWRDAQPACHAQQRLAQRGTLGPRHGRRNGRSGERKSVAVLPFSLKHCCCEARRLAPSPSQAGNASPSLRLPRACATAVLPATLELTGHGAPVWTSSSRRRCCRHRLGKTAAGPDNKGDSRLPGSSRKSGCLGPLAVPMTTAVVASGIPHGLLRLLLRSACRAGLGPLGRFSGSKSSYEVEIGVSTFGEAFYVRTTISMNL